MRAPIGRVLGERGDQPTTSDVVALGREPHKVLLVAVSTEGA